MILKIKNLPGKPGRLREKIFLSVFQERLALGEIVLRCDLISHVLGIQRLQLICHARRDWQWHSGMTIVIVLQRRQNSGQRRLLSCTVRARRIRCCRNRSRSNYDWLSQSGVSRACRRIVVLQRRQNSSQRCCLSCIIRACRIYRCCNRSNRSRSNYDWLNRRWRWRDGRSYRLNSYRSRIRTSLHGGEYSGTRITARCAME